MGPYGAAYPQDELSKIKMRNRRFQQSCAMEGMHLYGPAIGPVWRGMGKRASLIGSVWRGMGKRTFLIGSLWRSG